MVQRNALHGLMITLAVAVLAVHVSAAPPPGIDSPSTNARQSGTKDGAKISAPASHTNEAANVLTPDEWNRVDNAVNRALTWLAAQQADGSFPTLATGQPGVTCLCVMAFISQGHVPGEGPYGKQLQRATDFVISCQKENGLLTLVGPDGPRITRNLSYETGSSASYNHAISSLLLSELFGMSSDKRDHHIEAVINKSLATTFEMQRWPKARDVDRGGWRYVSHYFNNVDSDLSVTGWELMFLRSARNAGFDVPKQSIDEAVAYVRRCYSQDQGAFEYESGKKYIRSGMSGAGILALAHAGDHRSPEAQAAGRWILQHDFDRYNDIRQSNGTVSHDRYHYAVFNCCQGMYQLGGRYWKDFFPRTVRTLLANQKRDGSWPADSHMHDGPFGSSYTTALVVLSLGAPNQMLPIYQR